MGKIQAEKDRKSWFTMLTIIMGQFVSALAI